MFSFFSGHFLWPKISIKNKTDKAERSKAIIEKIMFNMVTEDSKHKKHNRDNSYAETENKKILDIEQYLFIFFFWKN